LAWPVRRAKADMILTYAQKVTVAGVAFGALAVVGGFVAVSMAAVGRAVTAGMSVLAPAGVVAFGGLAWLQRRRIRNCVSQLAGQLRRMSESPEAGAQEFRRQGSLGVLADALNQFLGRWRGELEGLRTANRELQVRARLADLEKRQVEVILHSISDAVIVTNPFDELVLANAAAERLLGFSLCEASRKNIERVLGEEDLVQLVRDTRVGRRTEKRKTVERVMQADGQPRTFRVTFGCAATGDEREAGGVVAVFQDVTKEKEIAQMKSDFVSHVSHELRSPLAGIKGYIEMLLDGDADDPKTQREFHQIIAAETDRLGRLIDNILNISRIESGVVKVVKEPQDLTSVVKEVLEVAGPQASAKGIRLVEQLAPVFAQVPIDRDMMSQAVTNLVSNAIKYTAQGGTVCVSASVDEGRGVAVCEVRDTGAGIPAEDLPRIFDKFYRVKANSKMAKGTGLGLNLVKQIVEVVHEGRLEVSSKVGEGSVFRFELPICR